MVRPDLLVNPGHKALLGPPDFLDRQDLLETEVVLVDLDRPDLQVRRVIRAIKDNKVGQEPLGPRDRPDNLALLDLQDLLGSKVKLDHKVSYSFIRFTHSFAC